MLYHSTGFQGLQILCFWDHHLWHLLAESIIDCFKAQMEDCIRQAIGCRIFFNLVTIYYCTTYNFLYGICIYRSWYSSSDPQSTNILLLLFGTKKCELQDWFWKLISVYSHYLFPFNILLDQVRFQNPLHMIHLLYLVIKIWFNMYIGRYMMLIVKV